MSDTKHSVVLHPGQGVEVGRRPNGGGATFKVRRGETGGSLSIFESMRPAGDLGGAPLHQHAFDEAFYVLEGEYVLEVDDRVMNAAVGSFVYVPRGTPHALRHTGDGVGRLLTICHPGGIEEIFAANGAAERAAMEKKYGAEMMERPTRE
jgi:mannose-6-phosphate isomerase-like protein (cupin superfamily)